jgi:PAS domain S-box-containing protein
MEGRVLVLAPFGCDASEVCRVLAQGGLSAERCDDVDHLCAEIARGAAAALLAEEALSPEARGQLAAALAEQPAWSDFPLLVMTSALRTDGDGWQGLHGLEGTAHLTLLERPLRAATLLSAVRVAVESRRHQYQVRDELAARERAEESLRRSERRLALAASGTRIGMFDWDIATGQTFATEQQALLLGLTTTTTTTLSQLYHYTDWAQRVHRDDLARVEAELHRSMRDRRPYEAEYRVVWPDQSIHWIASRGVFQHDAHGQPQRMLGIALEMTDRKQAEEALRESEARFRTMADGLPLIVWVHDPEGRQKLVNRTFCEFFGVDPDEIDPDTWQMLVDPETSAAYVDEFLACLRSRRPFHAEARVRRADGQWRWIESWGRPRYSQSGEFLGFVGTSADVTERRRAEEALQELNETLEQRVAERTAEADRRARDLRRLATELSQAEHRERERLARILHDDLQQLLLAVKLRLPVLAGADPKKLPQHVDRLDELIGECMSTSRNLTQELSPPVIQRGSLVEVAEWLGTWFGEKHGLSVAVEAHNELPPMAEHLRVFLFQAVRELLMNAVKHSGSMEARVTLSSQDGNLTVQVEDGGSGFDPQAVEQRLQRPEGFGLFNVRERLEALLGRLEIQCTPEGGACFRLIVPVAEDAESLLEDIEPQRVKMVPSGVRKSRDEDGVARLLVVDDHAVVREGFIGLLDRQPDFEVVGEAADGEEAVRQAEALDPDVIIMDVDMPTMDGIEATRRIKERDPAIVVVGLSLYEEEAVARAMADAGADTYVSKHVPAKDFVEAIRRVCRPGGDA